MSEARIFDLGYRRYDGPRLGRSAAVRSLTTHTFGALIGRRRSVWAKLLTIVIAGMAYAPALVFLGLTLFVPEQIRDAVLPGSETYLGIIAVPVTLFVVLASPIALCPDRRSGLLTLYLASPLDRDTYLAAKAMAVVLFLGIVTLGPNLFLLLGSVLLGDSGVGVGEVTREVVRILAAGLAYSLLFGGLGLALSAVTDRRTAAAAGVAMWLIGSGAIVRGVLVETLQWGDAWGLLDLNSTAGETVRRIYGTRGELDVPTAAVALAAVAWVGAAGLFTRWRYQRLQVTR